ncbi:outer membrane protein with beta-barrel domain [Mariniflexile fucanivorans]|uniref:Outer membrane protein with beta-barrel domain n=1 Tax=Mariniflexile fucanivorans TaxID=264023 RepID=A0A4R1RF08_9FLAO|nr:porin family protein [Mariniflexile fucanivorans]TCL64511.1 outer membrane protein with beta-barrel domain [Mariniflexile fucanivorans]
MKKRNFITAFIFLLIYQFSQSQNNDNFKVGLNLGSNLFDLTHDESFNRYKGALSYSFGMSFEYIINSKFSIVSNINYDNKIMKTDYYSFYDLENMQELPAEDKTKFNYINVPLLIRFYFGNNNTFYSNAGLFYNYAINIQNVGKLKETGETVTFFEHEKIIKKYDYGVSLGIGTNFNLGDKNVFSIELKDELGIANIADYHHTNLATLKTNTIKLILNWELPI